MQMRALLTAAVLLGAAVNVLSAQEPMSSDKKAFLDAMVENGKMTEADRASIMASYESKVAASSLESRIDEMVASMNTVSALQSDYKPGQGFTWRQGNAHSLNVSGAIQSRFSYQNVENATANQNENVFGFSVPRARIMFRGVAFTDWGYEIDVDVAGDTDGGSARFTALRDAFVNWQKHSAFQVKAGQFKAPVGRQFLTEFSELQFVDRAFANDSAAFRPGRDVGLQFHGQAGGDEGDLFTYALGLFNGEGSNQGSSGFAQLINNGGNNDEGFLYAGRIMVSPFGGNMLTEGDHRPDSGPRDFILQIAVNAWYETNDTANQEDPYGLGADVAIYYEGFSAFAQFDYTEDSNNNQLEAWSALFQLGYMIVPGEFELAGRFSYFETDASGTNNTLDGFEVGGGINYFLAGHAAKVQFDVVYVDADASPALSTNPLGLPTAGLEDVIVRLQLQLVF